MGDPEITFSWLSSGDLEMGEPTSVAQAASKALNEKPQSGEGESSSNGKIRLQKINGCLQKAEVRPILVIQPEQVSEDVEYWRNHALICKFLGLRLSLSVLDSWAR